MTKAFVMHAGWLGRNEIEVTLERFIGSDVVVKAVQGHPFDMWQGASNIPNNAKVAFHNDTYWYDSKIVSIGAVVVLGDVASTPGWQVEAQAQAADAQDLFRTQEDARF